MFVSVCRNQNETTLLTNLYANTFLFTCLNKLNCSNNRGMYIKASFSMSTFDSGRCCTYFFLIQIVAIVTLNISFNIILCSQHTIWQLVSRILYSIHISNLGPLFNKLTTKYWNQYVMALWSTTWPKLLWCSATASIVSLRIDQLIY